MLGLRKGTAIPAAEDFDIAYLKPLIQKRIVVPLIDAAGFEDVSGEDQYSQNTKTIKRLNIKGLPEYRLMFEEGHEFYRELDKLESFKAWDWIIGDTDGNWMLVKKSNGDFKGFEAGHVTPELTTRQVEGGDPEKKSLLIQFLNRLEWDRNYEILHVEELTMTPQELPQINGVEITFDAAPADTDTTFGITVVLASDRNTGVEGLLAADFKLQVDGVDEAITNVVDNGGGSYTFTVAAMTAAEVLTLTTYHAATATTVADSNDVLYASVETATEVVTA